MSRLVASFGCALLTTLLCRVTTSANGDYAFPSPRTSYVLNLVAGGTDVADRSSGVHTLVPLGSRMTFAGTTKYSKDSLALVRTVRSHLEAYVDWNLLADLPVDFLRTGPYYNYGANGWSSGQPLVLQNQSRFPDRADKTIVAYVNAMEFSAIGQWDPSFNPAWDRNGDAIIDSSAANLPAYVDVNVFNATWKNYVAAYWTEAWREQIARKIDLVAAEHFDGVMLDVMTGHWTWKNTYPQMDVQQLQQRTADLFRWAADYAKRTYGSSFVVSANLAPEAKDFFADLGRHIDAGYYQNAFFRWDGSGIVDGYGVSTSPDGFVNANVAFVKSQGLAVLDMDHLGTGPVTPGLNFTNYDDRITDDNLRKLLVWAIQSDSTPYCSQLFFGQPYGVIPRFVRLVSGRPTTTNTPYPDWVIGSTSADDIGSGAGDDLIYGGPGDDRIDGGSGVNKAFYLGARANFRVYQSNGSVMVEDRTREEGTDTVTNIQVLQFADQAIEVSQALLASATLTITRAGSGFGTVTDTNDAIACGAACRKVYAYGTDVTLSATPDPGSVFGGWSGDADCLDGTVTMTADRSCAGLFVPRPGAPARPGSMDFNGDGVGDTFRYDPVTGAWALGLSTSTGAFGNVAGTWSRQLTVEPGDFNGDRLGDLLLYNAATGQWSIAVSAANGAFTFSSASWSSGWRPIVVDLNGDGRSDVFLYDPATGVWFKCFSVGTTVGDFSYVSGVWSPGWELYPADFNGDRRADLFLYQRVTGQWFRAVNDSVGGFSYVTERWSPSWEIHPGDFNGDGLTDIFLYDPRNGLHFFCTTAGAGFTYSSGSLGAGLTVTVVYLDADASADLLLYNKTSGSWTERTATNSFTGQWDAGWDVYVGELNADTRDDLVLYNRDTGQWVQALNAGNGLFTYGSGVWAPRLTILTGRARIP